MFEEIIAWPGRASHVKEESSDNSGEGGGDPLR